MLSLAPEFMAGIREVLQCQLRQSVLQVHDEDATSTPAQGRLCTSSAFQGDAMPCHLLRSSSSMWLVGLDAAYRHMKPCHKAEDGLPEKPSLCDRQGGRKQAGVADLGKFVAVLGLQVALHIGHELVEAGGQVGLPIPRVRCNYPVPQRGVYLRAHSQVYSPLSLAL